MSDDIGQLITAGFTILVSLAYFCLGISEAIFVSRYSEFDDQCRQIWQWILAACVFDIVIPVLGCCGLRELTKDKDEKESDVDKILWFARIGTVIIAIWSAVTYYNINSSCHYFWTSEAPQMWTFIMIHFVAFWIAVAFFCITVLLLICMGCCACFAPKEQKTIMRQQSKLFNTFANKFDTESV